MGHRLAILLAWLAACGGGLGLASFGDQGPEPDAGEVLVSGDFGIPRILDAGQNCDAGVTDVVFLLDDTDGSCIDGMGVPEFLAVRQAIGQLEEAYNFRFGLIVAPGCTGLPNVYQLADPAQAMALSEVQCTVSGEEQPCDQSYVDWLDLVADQACCGPIAWDPDAKHWIVVFTSEAALGTYSIPGVNVVAFTVPHYEPGWDLNASQTFLLGTSDQMLLDMRAVLYGSPQCSE